MSIESIIKRIDDEAEAAAAEILDKAEGQAELVREEYAKRGAKLAEELDRASHARAGGEERRLVVAEELEMRKQVLERKRELLAEVYREARSRIERLPADRYLELVKSLILRHAVSGREEIVVPESQREIFSAAFVDGLNGAKEGAAFRLANAPGAFAWGVVLREGQRRVDLTGDVVFEQLSSRIESRVAAALFAE